MVCVLAGGVVDCFVCGSYDVLFCGGLIVCCWGCCLEACGFCGFG